MAFQREGEVYIFIQSLCISVDKAEVGIRAIESMNVSKCVHTVGNIVHLAIDNDLIINDRLKFIDGTASHGKVELLITVVDDVHINIEGAVS